MFSYALFLLLFYVDVRVTCSHACMMLLPMPCLDLCLYVYFHTLWLDPCLHMLVCSNSCSFHIYVLGLYMSMCMFPCLLVLIYMFSHAYVLGFVFSTCFMPSSRCLHASHFVYALRPRPCLSCHVLL